MAMKGGGGVVLRVDDGTYTHDVINPQDATVSLSLNSSGVLTILADSGTSYNWVTGALPSGYEVRVTATVGSVSSGTVGSWLPLSTTRTWTVERTILGTKTATLTVEIGLLGASSVLEAGTITMSATVDA